MPKLNLFLSHVTVESRLADIFRARLSKDFIGLVNVFESSDRVSIPAGVKWLDEVTSALKRADLHLIICSDEAITRPWIHFEAGAAHIRGVRIIPVCHSGLAFAHLPVPLSVYEGIQASEPDGLRALYTVIANALESQIPEVDFDVFARTVNAFETEYQVQRQSITTSAKIEGNREIIRNPRVLCVSSPQFAALGYENQLQIVLNAFPQSVDHSRVFSSTEFRKALSDDKTFDIVHIAAFVCPRSGDLYFSDVDVNTGAGVTANPDVLGADELASLLELAKTKLVVIGSCDSVALAATLVSTCNVIAARDMVSARMMASWVEAFYAKLPNRPLSEALDYAGKFSKAPMRYYSKTTLIETLFGTASATTTIATDPVLH